jgi:hypothetical protein
MSIQLVIFGLGNHTKTKIIPALNLLSIPIKAIISNIDLMEYESIKVFKKISSIKDKNTITHCIISTTPSKQIKYIQETALMNVKTFVEKPAFTSEKDLASVSSFMKSSFSLTEGMMYRFGEGYKYFYTNFKKEKDFELSLKFILPNQNYIINKTFRNKIDIKNSIIYDIGPYIFDLLWTLGLLDFEITNIVTETFKNNIYKRFKFILIINDKHFFKKINVDIGYGESYLNEINFFSKGYQLNVHPFFWGRSGKINIQETLNTKKNSIEINSKGAFNKILLNWINNKDDKLLDLQNFKRYEFVISQLLNLEREIFTNVKQRE